MLAESKVRGGNSPSKGGRLQDEAQAPGRLGGSPCSLHDLPLPLAPHPRRRLVDLVLSTLLPLCAWTRAYPPAWTLPANSFASLARDLGPAPFLGHGLRVGCSPRTLSPRSQ